MVSARLSIAFVPLEELSEFLKAKVATKTFLKSGSVTAL